jgi:hypothetical protein
MVWFILDKTLKCVGRVPKMKGPALGTYPRAFLFVGEFFAKFRPEKNESNLCKGVFMEKKWPKFTIF